MGSVLCPTLHRQRNKRRRKMKFRQLNANEIECRVGTVKYAPNQDPKKAKFGCSLLLYKTARLDANVLDETVGAENWCVRHYQVKDKDFAEVGIKMEDGTWVYKSDCGSESNVEAEKGESSDALKRACFMWGLGRALYSAPFIWINLTEDDFYNGKISLDVKFAVTQIKYDLDGDICLLEIKRVGKNGQPEQEAVFSWKNNNAPVDEYNAMQAYRSLKMVFKDTVVINSVLKKLGADKPSAITEQIFDKAVKELKEVVK